VPIPKLIIIGGFLGAGKTTLMAQARKTLERENLRVGLITNDQAPGLVDTALLGGGEAVEELTGSCFCCDFGGFGEALAKLAGRGAEVILAEPVGSCVDLSATVVQPLKDLAKGKYLLAPFSVVLDPARAREALGTRESLLHKDALYILRKQLSEADRIVLNKVDLLGEGEARDLSGKLAEAYPQAKVSRLSAKDGTGVGEWLGEALKSPDVPGGHLIEVDYDQYANGEAVLGWLNLAAETDFGRRGGRDALSGFLDGLQKALRAKKMTVGHVKVWWPCPEGSFVGNLIDDGGQAAIAKIDGKATPGPILVNVRAEGEPGDLEKLVRETLSGVAAANNLEFTVKEAYCLKPGRPNPTHRYSKVV
jgi:Ni2+-binding GTPase involved in maturation of urease and hydrogenase